MKTKELLPGILAAPVVVAVATIALAMVLSTSSFAQVKIGTNPTVITTNANLDVEGNNNTHMVVMKPGQVGINTTAPVSTLHVRAISNNNSPWVSNVIAQFDPFGGSNVSSRASLLINDRTAFGYDIDAQQNKYSFVRGNSANDFRVQVIATDGTLHGNAFVMSAQDGNTGFIGLNTEKPQSRLDVRGTLKVISLSSTQTGELYNGTSNINGFEVQAGGGDAYAAIQRNGASANLYLSKPSAGTPDGAQFQRFAVGGNLVGSVTLNGSGISYNQTSDQRLKENIRTTKFGLQALKTVKVYDYNFKTDKNKTLSTGVLA